jgi:hypothetical protein
MKFYLLIIQLILVRYSLTQIYNSNAIYFKSEVFGGQYSIEFEDKGIYFSISNPFIAEVVFRSNSNKSFELLAAGEKPIVANYLFIQEDLRQQKMIQSQIKQFQQVKLQLSELKIEQERQEQKHAFQRIKLEEQREEQPDEELKQLHQQVEQKLQQEEQRLKQQLETLEQQLQFEDYQLQKIQKQTIFRLPYRNFEKIDFIDIEKDEEIKIQQHDQKTPVRGISTLNKSITTRALVVKKEQLKSKKIGITRDVYIYYENEVIKIFNIEMSAEHKDQIMKYLHSYTKLKLGTLNFLN